MRQYFFAIRAGRDTQPERAAVLKSAAAKARRPEMNIIIVTGYSAPKNDEIPPGSLFIPKPYNARKMIEAVRHFQ